MAITIPTYDELEALVLAFFRNRFPGRDTHTESFLGKLARAIARSLSAFLVSVQNADNDALPTNRTSSAALDIMAVIFGLPSDAAGHFGRKGATAATGGVAPCTGTNGTAFPDQTQLTAPDGVTQIKLNGGVAIAGTPPGTGSVNGSFVAVTAGTAGNLDAGTVLTWVSPPSGADGSVTLTSPLGGALDRETDAALLARILDRLQNPPKGGTASDFRTWSESVTGVARSYVYPRRRGAGTVDMVITAGGSGTGRNPGAVVRDADSQYINGDGVTVEGKRPVTSEPSTVDLPYMAPTGSGLKLRVRVLPQNRSAYKFDWPQGNVALTVAGFSAGVITTNESLPVALYTAVQAYKDSPSTVDAPRIQVMATALPEPGIAVPVRVIDYNVGASTLTLETPLPSGWTPPVAGNSIYTYGGTVPIVAPNLQAYVDSLGPSRAGGYANPLDVWPDTCSIFEIGRAALDALDDDNVSHPVSRVIAATINGAATDVQASDTVANGIELLYTAQIAVTD